MPVIPISRRPSLAYLSLAGATAYFVVVAVLVGRLSDVVHLLEADLAGLTLLGAGVAGAIILAACLRHYPERPLVRPIAVVRLFLRGRRSVAGVATVCIPMMAAALTLSAYNVFKQFVLPDVGFWFGKDLAAADRALLGRDAWQITHALFPHAWETKVLDVIYHSWFAPMSIGIVACCFARSGSALAERYVASYVLVWIVQGSALAYALPAAGPCFAASLRHVTRFAPLMARLRAQQAYLNGHGAGGLTALGYQATLLDRFGSGEAMLGGGIAAMPSLHNALATLFACAGFKIDRRLGIALGVYSGFIWIGSIHLGWHYALDGVAGSGGAILIWQGCGWWQRRAVLPARAPQLLAA